MSSRLVSGYEVVGELGRGASSVVYVARQSQLGGRSVALKVIQRSDIDASALRRFERERASLARLSRAPGVVTVFDAGVTDDGWPWLSMELMEGGSLAEWIRTNGRTGAELVVQVGVVLCGALEAAHEVGVLHRDIKPENVLLDRDGRPKLADFGIASVADMGVTRSTSSSLRGFTGTIAHAAPELLSGGDPSVASDIYGLGSTLFTMIAGHAPYVRPGEENLLALLRRIALEPIPSLEPFGAPPQVAAAITKCLAIEPAERPVSARQLADDLVEAFGSRALALPALPVTVKVIDEAPIEAIAEQPSAPAFSQTWSASTVHELRPEPPVEPPARTHRGLVMLAVAAGVLAFAGGAHAMFGQDPGDDAAVWVAALSADSDSAVQTTVPVATTAVVTTVAPTTIVEQAAPTTIVETTVAPTTVVETTVVIETTVPPTAPPDVTPPILAVTSHFDGGHAEADGAVGLWGVVEAGATVTVDGVPVDYLPGDGNWSHETTLGGADSKAFTIVATDPAGNTETAVVTLTLPPPPPPSGGGTKPPSGGGGGGGGGVSAPTVSLSGPTSITQGLQYSWSVSATNAIGGTWTLSGSPTVTVSRPNWTPGSGFSGYFNSSGATYTLTLTVYNSAGVQARDSITFTVVLAQDASNACVPNCVSEP